MRSFRICGSKRTSPSASSARGAAKELIDERVDDALRIVGMAKFLDALPARIVRRPAAARRHRARAGGAPARAAARRAAVGARRADPPLHGRGDRPAASRSARSHHSLCHPRPERGADARRPHRDPARTASSSAHRAHRRLYRRPPNRFAAEFLGRANLLPVVVEGGVRRDGLVAVARRRRPSSSSPSDGAPTGARRLLCVRPQHLTLTRGTRLSNRICGRAARSALAGRTHPSRRRGRATR